MKSSAKRRGLKRRYGRAGGHPLPRMVVYMHRDRVEGYGGELYWKVTVKLQRVYGGPWTKLTSVAFPTAQEARVTWRALGAEVAERHGVPLSHIEYTHGSPP